MVLKGAAGRFVISGKRPWIRDGKFAKARLDSCSSEKPSWEARSEIVHVTSKASLDARSHAESVWRNLLFYSSKRSTGLGRL